MLDSVVVVVVVVGLLGLKGLGLEGLKLLDLKLSLKSLGKRESSMSSMEMDEKNVCN